MADLLEEISQISIHLKERNERINEIALFHPLERSSAFDEMSKPLKERSWSYMQKLPLLKRWGVKLQTFLFKRVPALIPAERLSVEAKLKTAVALMLVQESLRDYFFSDEKRKAQFHQAVKEVAQERGVTIDVSRLTVVNGVNLLENPVELNLQKATLSLAERNAILYAILDRVERAPITSVLEVMAGEQTEELELTTCYAKYKVESIGRDGVIDYRYAENQATSSIRTQENIIPGVKGAMNQRCALDSATGEWIGSYSGQLSCEQHVLEQILFIVNAHGKTARFVENPATFDEKSILFTSLLSWHEISLITDQHRAIHTLNGKFLQVGEHTMRLNLVHMNIPFGALNKYPTPAEMGATLRDINDEAMITLLADFLPSLGLEAQTFIEMKEALKQRGDFLEEQERTLAIIDTFNELKPGLISLLESLPKQTPLTAAITLLKGKVRGMDKLLHLNALAWHIGYFHTKNCEKSTDRSAGANAADKAQYATLKLHGHLFLPGEASEKEISLFKVFYSMYLVWEEPEITTGLSTGFIGEKFHQSFFAKNPETTRYLIHWLKKHPEMYLGLSRHRT